MSTTKSFQIVGRTIAFIHLYMLFWSFTIIMSFVLWIPDSKVTVGDWLYRFVAGFLFFDIPLPFLQLVVIIALWAMLPKRLIRWLPLLATIVGASIAYFLRRLYGVDIWESNTLRLVPPLFSSVILSAGLGFFLQYLTKRTSAAIASTVLITATSICIPCLLFYFLVFPGRYQEDPHANYRVDLLTGQLQEHVEYCNQPGDGCYWKNTER